jgi:multidrug transporter EmrE-like cation transporter
MNWKFFSFLLGILLAFESVSLYCLQKYQKTKQISFLIYSIILYGIFVPFLLYHSLQHLGIGMVNFFWNIFSTLLGFIIGIYLFNEKINFNQVIGITLSILGVSIVILNDKK